MKKQISRIIVLLFVLTMCLLMSISAHAETGNRYFFTSASLPSVIKLDDMTITPTNVYGQVKPSSQKIFNENVSYYVRVRESQSTTTATKFTIDAHRKGVLLVYYTRSYDGSEPIANDGGDLSIVGMDGVVECCDTADFTCTAVKYYVLNAGTYTITAIDKTCGVYGFVYMPGNMAAYDVKGKGDVNLVGQFCTDYTNLPNLKEKKWIFNGWYKDQACTEKIVEGEEITEPTIVFAKWTRCLWDFEEYSGITLNNSRPSLNYDGLLIKGSVNNDDSFTRIASDHVLNLYSESTIEKNCVVFTPEYDGEMTVTFASTGTIEDRICAIGTDVVRDINAQSTIAYGVSNGQSVWKTFNAKMKAGVTYYIYNVTGGIKISNILYQASAASAVVDEDNVSLTGAANMQGWRPFYDADNSYTVDDNTNVYMVVEKENEEDAVILGNRTGKKVPKGSPVILHSDAVQEDGTYLITMTKDVSPYVYEGNDNLLRASVTGTPVDAYRLGYRAGEGNGIAFYSWSVDSPSAGIVYLDLSENNTAKIELEMEISVTGVSSVRNNDNEEVVIFNVNGQRLNVPQKGLNIINGKKVIVL